MNKLTAISTAITCAIILGLTGCSSSKRTNQFETGKTAFQQGQYHDAFTNLMPFANKGNPEAEYAVGYMFFYGKGTTQNTVVAKKWFTKAARQHYMQAKEALNMLEEQAQKQSSIFTGPSNQLMNDPGGSTLQFNTSNKQAMIRTSNMKNNNKPLATSSEKIAASEPT